MKLANDDLIAALRLRYDFYSAQTMLESALAQAGIAHKDAYDAAELAAFRAALSRIGDRLTAVDARLDALGAAPAATAQPSAPTQSSAPTQEPSVPTPPPAATARAPVPAPVPSAASPVTAAPDAPVPTAAKPATPGPAAPTETIETVITLTGVPVTEDERVLVCGGLPELGDWDVTRAAPMVRDGDRWLATLELAAGTEAPFKFVVCAPDGSATWESGANRNLVAAPSIELSWE